MINQQSPEKAVISSDGSLQVHSIFKTIQGEGPFTGQRAIFVRLAGCNLQCPLCDTEYTSHRGSMLPDELVTAIERYSIPEDEAWVSSVPELRFEMNNRFLVVITGGEPFRQFLRPTIEALLRAGFGIQIETNGTLFQELPYDDIVVVCSPKTGSINKQLVPYISTLKYVLRADQVSDIDGLPLSALDHPCLSQLARPPEGFSGMILLQPADEQDEEKNQLNLAVAVESVMEYGYVLQLQIHKLVGVP